MDHSPANKATENLIQKLLKKINYVGDLKNSGKIDKITITDLAYQLADMTGAPQTLCNGLIVYWLQHHPDLMCKKNVGIAFRNRREVKDAVFESVLENNEEKL